MQMLWKCVYDTSAWPHNPAQAALWDVGLPEAPRAPAPTGGLVGPTALRLLSHPAASHPGTAGRRVPPASCVQSERLLWWNIGVWNTVLALGGNGEASCRSRCSVNTTLADCPSLNHCQYSHAATGHCHSTRGSTKYSIPRTIAPT